MNSGCIILAHPLCALAGLPSTLMPSDYVWLLSRAWARGNRPSDVRCVEVEKNQDGVRENPSNRREIPLYDREIPVKIVKIFFGLFSNSSQALYVD